MTEARTLEAASGELDALFAKAEALSDDELDRATELQAEIARFGREANLRSGYAAGKAVNATPAGQAASDTADPKYNAAFSAYLRTGDANSDLIAAQFALGEGTPSAGGYLAPDGFRNKLVEKMKTFGGILSVVENITTSDGNPLPWPTVDDTGNVGEIVAEAAAPAAGADPSFGAGNVLSAYKYMSAGASNLPIRVSYELLQDSAFDLDAWLSKAMATRIHRAMAIDAVTGTGTGEPLGINHKAAVAATELPSGNVPLYSDLIDIIHAVDPAYRGNARWAFNDTTAAVFEKMVDGAQRPLWLPAATGSIGDRPGGPTLLGYPVTIDQAFPNIANSDGAAGEGFGVFGDLEEGYIWRNVRDVSVIVDPYSRKLNGQVEYIAWARADGTIQNPNSYVTIAGYNAP